jgi:hypothetical protein
MTTADRVLARIDDLGLDDGTRTFVPLRTATRVFGL